MSAFRLPGRTAPVALAVALAVSGLAAIGVPLPTVGAAADPGKPSTETSVAASRSLSVAERVLGGRRAASDPSASMALREVWRTLPGLPAPARHRAEALLARPTDGVDDPDGSGYTVPAVRECARNVCVHWVRSTADAPRGRRWVTRTLRQMQRVWRLETGRLGYRQPLGDGRRGGNRKFDVYLKDVGAVGLYGYCAPERRFPRSRASGYCVLDNDFSRSQFPGSPTKSLRVTAAHEFFHAVQYAYDAKDDRWLLEATATWMEERVADSANDNRRFLPYGQVVNPSEPLDTGGGAALNQYGNWAFFEFLSQRYGDHVVRQIWERAAADRGSPDLYSMQAIERVLAARGGFRSVFSRYAAGNTAPRKTYREGRRWPRATVAGVATLSSADRRSPRLTGTLLHLSSASYVFRPARSLRHRSWRLRVRIDGPKRRSSPSAFVLVHHQRGRTEKRLVRLDGRGDARLQLEFGSRRIAKVTVTMVNASTRFRCFRRTGFSCSGVARDDGLPYTIDAVARR